MDFTLIILAGLAAGSFGFVLGSGVAKITKTSIISFFQAQINAYVAGFLQNLQEHPDQVDAIVSPFMDSIMRALQGGEKGQPREKTFKVAGIPIPSSLISKGLEILLGRVGAPKQVSDSLLPLPS